VRALQWRLGRAPRLATGAGGTVTGRGAGCKEAGLWQGQERKRGSRRTGGWALAASLPTPEVSILASCVTLGGGTDTKCQT
jgi:hypothetical protein